MRPLVMWFLRRLTEWAHVDNALVGDILEEYGQTNSSLRLVRQMLWAIGQHVLGTVRSHPWLTMRALAIGWIIQLNEYRVLSSRVLSRPVQYLFTWNTYVQGRLEGALGFPVPPVVMLAAGALTAAFIGWVLSATSRSLGFTMGPLFVASLSLVMLARLATLSWFPAWESLRSMAFETVYSFLVCPAFLLVAAIAADAPGGHRVRSESA